jgi:hypothetical protein
MRPTRAQDRATRAIVAEATSYGVRLLGTKVLQLSPEAAPARPPITRFTTGDDLRIDTVQSLMLVTPGGDAVFVLVPWSGDLALAHELASLLPGTLPTNLRLRCSFGGVTSGRFDGDRGDDDPILRAAQRDRSIYEGICWSWQEHGLGFGIPWGLQAVPYDSTRTLHILHSGRRPTHDYRVAWFLNRRLAFVKFMRRCVAEGFAAGPGQYRAPAIANAVARFDPTPLAAHFLDDFRS